MTLFEIERETVSNDKLKFLCEKNLKVRFSNIYLKYNLPLLVQQLKLKNHGLVSENTHLFHGACTLKKQEKTLPTKKKTRSKSTKETMARDNVHNPVPLNNFHMSTQSFYCCL